MMVYPTRYNAPEWFESFETLGKNKRKSTINPIPSA